MSGSDDIGISGAISQPDRCECWWDACNARPERPEQRHNLKHPESRRLCRVHFRTAMQHDLCHRCGLRAVRYGLCGQHQIQESQMTTQACDRSPCISPDLCRRSGRCIMAPTVPPKWAPGPAAVQAPAPIPLPPGPGPEAHQGPEEPATVIEGGFVATHVSIDRLGRELTVGGFVPVMEVTICGSVSPWDDYRQCAKPKNHEGPHGAWMDGAQVGWDDHSVHVGDEDQAARTPKAKKADEPSEFRVMSFDLEDPKPKETRRELPPGPTFTTVLDSFLDAQAKKSPVRRALELAIVQAKVHVAQLEGILAALSDDS